jgi:hypothetical protein
MLAVLFLRLFSLHAGWVEHYYTFGVYPPVASVLRVLLGWLPFSIGDVLYLLAIGWLLWKAVRLIRLLRQRKAKAAFTGSFFRKYLKIFLSVYFIFLLFWGLNYYRNGVPAQLGLSVSTYSVQDLFDVALVLQQRLNTYAEKVDSLQRLRYNDNRFLFRQGIAAYQKTPAQYPFLSYHHPSIKSSFFTPVGKFVGFTGYYNPLTGEAQLKTDIPVFLKPFVVTHEIAHQLGYAKENEASFVAYLACKASGNIDLQYSAYFELYRDAIFQCRLTPNKPLTDAIRKNIHPRVRLDGYELQRYLLRNQNFIEPLMTGMYDRYLKLNNQPKGKATYDEVIAYLIAYMKRFGKEAI